MAHIISSPTTLKTLSHLEQGAGTYYSGTQAWNYRVCVSVSQPQKSECVLVCACLLPTEIMLAITVVPIRWKHYSFDVLLYHISLWQAIREDDELFLFLQYKKKSFFFSLPADKNVLLWSAETFLLNYPDEEIKSLINFRIMNLLPSFGDLGALNT